MENDLDAYADTRAGLDGGSKLSAYLAQGSLSPRQVYWTVKESGKAKESVDHFLMHLLVRDYRYLEAKFYGSKLFAPYGLQSKPSLEWAVDFELV